MEFYLYREGQQLGPYSMEAIQDLLRLGSISSEDLAWCDGLADWTPLRVLLADLPYAAPPVPRPARVATPTARAGTGTAELPFGGHLTRAFGYPFKRDGLVLIIGGGILNALPGLLALVPFVALLIEIVVSGYLAAYIFKLIQSSAAGDEQMPKWPEVSSFLEDILAPLLQVVVTMAVCVMAPLWMVHAWSGSNSFGLAVLAWSYLGLGLFCLPMALLGVALYDSLAALNPWHMLRSILRIPGAYLLALILLASLVGSERFIQGALSLFRVPILSALIAGCVGFYFLAVMTRIIGVLYFVHRDRLGWFRSR